MTEFTTTSIAGLNKAGVLAALYNNAPAKGSGKIHFDPTPMTVQAAQKLIESFEPGKAPTFDYIKGRPIKVDLSGDQIVTEWYNCDNGGDGKAEKVIARFATTGEIGTMPEDPTPVVQSSKPFQKLSTNIVSTVQDEERLKKAGEGLYDVFLSEGHRATAPRNYRIWLEEKWNKLKQDYPEFTNNIEAFRQMTIDLSARAKSCPIEIVDAIIDFGKSPAAENLLGFVLWSRCMDASGKLKSQLSVDQESKQMLEVLGVSGVPVKQARETLDKDFKGIFEKILTGQLSL